MTYRNQKYLDWAKSRRCLVSGKKAEVAHHVRFKDNSSGVGLRPSDYRVLPLLHSYHTTGRHAVHRIGPLSFYERFSIDPDRSIITLLKDYLGEIQGVKFSHPQGLTDRELIPLLEEKIESLRTIEEIEAEKLKEERKRAAFKKSRKTGENTKAALKLKALQDISNKERAAKAKEFKKGLVPTEAVMELQRNIKEQRKKIYREQRDLLKEYRKKQKELTSLSKEHLEFKAKMKKEQSERRKAAYQKSKEWAKSLAK
jgi:hypothetical protein